MSAAGCRGGAGHQPPAHMTPHNRPEAVNVQVSSRARTSQPHVRLETCAFATVAGARGEPVPDDLLHPNPGSGASRDELPSRSSSYGSRRRFQRGPGRTPWRGGAGGVPGAVRCGSVSKSATKASHGGIGRGQKREISTFLFACPGAIRAFVADLDNTAPPAPPRKAPPDQFAPRRQQHRRPPRPPPSPPDRETTTPRDLTFCYASFPPLRLFALCYAPFSRTVEGGGA